jgi:hypothetical protein
VSTTPRAARAACLALAWVFAAAPAARAQEPDLTVLALQWLSADWAAPLVCEIAGRPVRGVRRMRVEPDRRHGSQSMGEMRFFDLAAPEATRCTSELGAEEPEVRGALVFRLERPSRPDLAMRDFEQALRRDGGFDFSIESGRLHLQRVGGAEPPRAVDFAGGTLRARLVRPGSDAARLLAEFPQPRKLTFELEARDGTRLRFHGVGR